MNFKYEIGEDTPYGKIKARYYREWLNRNGGLISGYFYEFSNTSLGLNQELLEVAIKEQEDEELNNLEP